MIGSAGTQIALFADTIIGSMLPTGGVSSIYYADRIYQLPLGVIGIAAGTVLLPEMSRLFAAGNPGARACMRKIERWRCRLRLTAPFFIAFIMIPDVIMRGVFERGAFTAEAASASAAVLTAYGFGLVAIVLVAFGGGELPSKRRYENADADRARCAVAINVGLKIVLFKPFGAAGLAAATAAGAWINFLLSCAFSRSRRGAMKIDLFFWKTATAVTMASFILAVFALVCRRTRPALDGDLGRFANVFELLYLALPARSSIRSFSSTGLWLASAKAEAAAALIPPWFPGHSASAFKTRAQLRVPL